MLHNFIKQKFYLSLQKGHDASYFKSVASQTQITDVQARVRSIKEKAENLLKEQEVIRV